MAKQQPSSSKTAVPIYVYLDDGRIFYYTVVSESKAREHIFQISQTGYRHCDGTEFEHYPPHRILKIKSRSFKTQYSDTVLGT